MLPSVGIYTYAVDAYLSDFRGRANLPMIGRFMLQAATRHAEERGFGYSSMTENRSFWVLTRMNIVIHEYPLNDIEVKVHTWISDVNKLFTERCFAFEDNSGKFFGYARSLWASIDLETKRPMNLLELSGFSEYLVKEPSPIAHASKIGLPKNSEYDNFFVVKYSDLDINKHLNSIKYIEHFIDSFPLEMYQHKEIHGFEINYIAEGYYGQKLNIFKHEIEDNKFVLEMRDADKVICSSKVTWNDLHY
ncbi:MAG: hypothetical protein RL662_2250 [Bacteroidota bacterium]|jgi:acyl-ACP thioesterase